jgi:hypothetical protein
MIYIYIYIRTVPVSLTMRQYGSVHAGTGSVPWHVRVVYTRHAGANVGGNRG